MSAPDYKKQVEDLQILLAWCTDHLSEGQASKALSMHRVETREARDTAIERGCEIYRRRRLKSEESHESEG